MTPELKKIAVDAARSYLEAPPLQDGRTLVEIEAKLDRDRFEVIENALRPLLAKYLERSISTGDFKRQIDGINKQKGLWGFRGTKGQMFFNLLVNAVEEIQASPDLDDMLRLSIVAPANDQNANTILKNFKDYLVRVGQKFVESGSEPRSKPNPSSIPFFLSYFWQIQLPDNWPVYYTSAVQTMEGMNLWQATGDIGVDYLAYKRIYEELVELFTGAFDRKFGLYDVEHVFWFKSGRLLAEIAPAQVFGPSDKSSEAGKKSPVASSEALVLEGYVPPIVATIPGLAVNDPKLQEAAQRTGTTLERALEKSINAALTMLGYETSLLGQGKGRVPDGQAIAVDESYALIWDAKARADGYKMGTDDRIIRQYIDFQSRNLKRSRGIRNIYYVIFSSGFSDEFDDLVRSLKMETNVNEVCFVEATALVELVNQRLRAPLSVGLGPDGIQRLFSSSGIITANDVLETLTV